MSQQERWPSGGNTASDLENKLSKCIWWLIILAKRMDIDINQALDEFLSKLEIQF